MPTMTVKEWAEAYRRNNEWEQQERLARLPHETVEDSVRSYFALCAMFRSLSNESEESGRLWELRLKHYQTLAGTWRRLARQLEHAT